MRFFFATIYNRYANDILFDLEIFMFGMKETEKNRPCEPKQRVEQANREANKEKKKKVIGNSHSCCFIYFFKYSHNQCKLCLKHNAQLLLCRHNLESRMNSHDKIISQLKKRAWNDWNIIDYCLNKVNNVNKKWEKFERQTKAHRTKRATQSEREKKLLVNDSDHFVLSWIRNVFFFFWRKATTKSREREIIEIGWLLAQHSFQYRRINCRIERRCGKNERTTSCDGHPCHAPVVCTTFLR